MTECPGYSAAKADPSDDSVDASRASDLEWHLNRAHPHLFCGGCGRDDCHPGRCCGDVEDRLGFTKRVCDLCPDRMAAGQVAERAEVRAARPLPLHRTEAGYPRCSTCDGGGCPDCTDPS